MGRKKKKVILEMYSTRDLNSGVGEFCYRLGVEIAVRAVELRQKHGIELCYIVPENMKGAFGNEISYMTYTLSKRLLFKTLRYRGDLFHATHQYAHVKRLHGVKNTLMTVHDINFMYEREGAKRDERIRKFKSKIAKSGYLCAISDFVRRDILANFEYDREIRVIHNGTTDLAAAPQGDIRELGLPEGYLFHISSLLPKKNVHLLVEMMRLLPDENLVIAGSWGNDYARELRARVEGEGLKNIIMLDSVSAETKAALYANCKAFLFPSLCEGFGLPPIEAMYMGKPVFLSDLTSLPEVGGPEAYYWDTLEPEAMADVFRRSMAEFGADPSKSDRIRRWAMQYNWTKCADQYIQYYIDILEAV